MSRTTAAFLFVLTVLLLGVGAWRTVDALARKAAAAEPTSAGPAVVEVARVERRLLRDVVSLSGTLRPVNEVDIVSDVPGRVVAVQAEIGDQVAAGAILARLDDDDFAAGLKQAKASVTAAKATHESSERELASSERLFAAQGMSEVQIIAARGRAIQAGAQLEQAEAGYAVARERHEDATIRSPITGVLTERTVGVGQTVNPGVPLFHVQDVSALELEGQLDERVAALVKPGMVVDVAVRGAPPVAGTVRVVSPSLDARTRKAKVVVSVPDAPFLPYATAEARLVLQESDVLAVPSAAIIYEADRSLVVAVRGTVVQRVPVVLGISDGDLVEIDTLAEGDLVVTSGAAGLREASAVVPRVAAVVEAK